MLTEKGERANLQNEILGYAPARLMSGVRDRGPAYVAESPVRNSEVYSSRRSTLVFSSDDGWIRPRDRLQRVKFKFTERQLFSSVQMLENTVGVQKSAKKCNDRNGFKTRSRTPYVV